MAFIEDGYYFTWDILDYSVDAIFFLDLIFNFLTPYYHQNYLVTNNKKIALNYLKGWFIIDLIVLILSNSTFSLVSHLPH